MERVSRWTREVMDSLEAAATEERRRVGQGYFKSEMKLLGVAVPDSRAIVKRVRTELRSEPPETVLALAHALIETGYLEARSVAYELVAGHKATMHSLTAKQVEALGDGNDNWATTDAFSCLISGILWLRRELSDEVFERWVQSENVWWRRTAVVSTTPLNQRSKGGRGDFERTLAMVDPVRHETHPMISKAVSWALRNLVQWDAKRVAEYLEAHDEELPALVKREVLRKIHTGRK